MIDIALLRAEPQLFRDSQQARGADVQLVDLVLAADAARREAAQVFESRRAEQKVFSKSIGAAAPDERPALLERGKALSAEVKGLEAEAAEADAEFARLSGKLANLILPGVPAGGEDDFVVLKTVGAPRDFAAEGVEVRDHLDLGEALGIIDTQRGAKVSGARFHFLKGAGALLELGLLQLALAKAQAAGFVPMIPPTLVKPEIMAGTGFLGEHADEIYRLEADDLFLTGTSEVALAGYHAGEIVDLDAGPIRYAGISSCYRREAGSYGKDTRGIIRVHQFQKVELFSYVQPDQAEAEHERLLALEEDILAACELPYQVIVTAAGDLGTSAAKKYDCEAWFPSQGKYRELTSTSNCTTFQARRLQIRERGKPGQHGTQPVATLNGTASNTRWVAAILENHQQADGSIRVPEALRPFLGGATVIAAA